jgi:hypothetical protein
MGDERETHFFCSLFHEIKISLARLCCKTLLERFDPRESTLSLNPRVHFDVEEIQLHGAVFQNLVVEGAVVKLGA